MASMWKKTSLLLLALSPAVAVADLPIVDLGYELHQAISLNDSTRLYNFSNIRYAAPPLGDLRFRAPVPPEVNREQVQKGDVGRICPQATTVWQNAIAPGFLYDYFTGQHFNGSANVSTYPYQPSPPDPRTTEDCLFLDVVVPQRIFDDAQGNSPCAPKKRELAPVLVWIYGGGYVFGEKSSNDPSGLIRRSHDGIVYVALNYRLGAFGWLAGASLAKDGTPNAALYDQRLALDWVYKYIHLFGGDPKRVTVMGESAGGGSIMHQITAFGGQKGKAPFQQAILQSPGFEPIPEPEVQEATLQEFLSVLKVSSIEEARKLSSDQLIAGNAYQVATQSTYGTFTYGPVVDGIITPELPGKLLLENDFDHDVNIMVGHNAHEGILFTSPESQSNSGLKTLILQEFPDTPPDVVHELTQVLYPPIYNGSYGYTNPVDRVAMVIAESAFTCNTDYLNRAFHSQTYAYLFDVPPATHGMDVPYTFYDGHSSKLANATIALVLQDYITSFVQFGKPNSTIGPEFDNHKATNNLMDLNPKGIVEIPDNTANPRCLYWQKAPYYVPKQQISQ